MSGIFRLVVRECKIIHFQNDDILVKSGEYVEK